MLVGGDLGTREVRGLVRHGGGPARDHEYTREVDAVERARRGMQPMLRLGSAWYNIAAQITAITERGLDPRQFILCTDDVHAGTLVAEATLRAGHAIGLGLDPLIALQMATINTAQNSGVQRDLGCLAPGRYADVVLAEDLDDFVARTVITRGELAAEEGEAAPRPAALEARGALSPLGPRAAAAGRPRLRGGCRRPHGHGDGQRDRRDREPCRHPPPDLDPGGGDGRVQPDPAQDVQPLALVERHHGTGRVMNGFVQGFGFDAACGVATTVPTTATWW